MLYIVYQITNTQTGRYYIGKHKTNDVNDGYFGSPGKTSDFLKDIQKYGKHIFKKELLHFATTKEEMEKIEENLVKINKEDPLSYNIQRGGKGGDPPKTIKKGKDNPMFGKSGAKNPAYGKIWITDGINELMIPKDFIIPIGWRRGKSDAFCARRKQLTLGKNNPMYGAIPSNYQRQRTKEVNTKRI